MSTTSVKPSGKASTRTSQSRRSKGTSAVGHGQRRTYVVDEILADVFRGKLKAGERLVIQGLAKRFKMSQTPIREALVTLEGIGIVDSAPNCGAVVRRVTANDVREVCQVRQALECSAVQSACGRIDLATLHDLAASFKKRSKASVPKRPSAEVTRKSVALAQKLDCQLHDLIADSCGNRFLSKELGRLKLLFRGFRDVSWDRRSTSDLLRLAEEAREHFAIVDALIACDAQTASLAMAKHIQSGERYWSRGMDNREINS